MSEMTTIRQFNGSPTLLREFGAGSSHQSTDRESAIGAIGALVR